MVAGEMGDWKLTDAQAKTLREYLLRGGFSTWTISGGRKNGSASTKA